METAEQSQKKQTGGKIARIAALIAIVLVFVAIIITSMSQKTPNSEKVWYPEMTVGNMDAKNYFVIYSDIACPYCIAFENAIVENQAEFEKYIADNDVLVEIRVADFLYEYGESNPIESRYGAEAIYCAKDAGKFWEYYDLAVTRVWNDYFKNAGKSAFSEFNKLGLDYWADLGKEVGLGEDFVSCVKENKTLDEVKANAKRMTKIVPGMPYFKFNNYTSSGFDLSWGWNYVLMYFDAGLKS
ncbi:thioredoxin domain-containing protein [Candidatus Saccharibacteria bacterium]|nr:thioredoxin domain-containing protein [Candidatus Saccharibacteria bacterium]